MIAIDYQSTIARLSRPGSAIGSAMPFVLTKDRIQSAVDPEANARLVIDGTTEIEYLKAKFESPEIRLSVPLVIESKFPERPFVPNDQTNPSIKISAGNLNFSLQAKKMLGLTTIQSWLNT
jgi:hypothetical protein